MVMLAQGVIPSDAVVCDCVYQEYTQKDLFFPYHTNSSQSDYSNATFLFMIINKKRLNRIRNDKS